MTSPQTPPAQVYAWARRFPHQIREQAYTEEIIMAYHTAPSVPAPTRRRRIWPWVVSLVVGGVLLCLVGSVIAALVSPKPKTGWNQPLGRPSATVAQQPTGTTAPVANPGSKMGVPVRDGQFEFTVTNLAANQTIPNTKPQGQFVVVAVKVRNIGKEARTWIDGNQYAYDAAGRKFSADSGAGLLMASNSGRTWLDAINPGNAVEGWIVFDVPPGVKLTRLELHDSMLSRGVKIDL